MSTPTLNTEAQKTDSAPPQPISFREATAFRRELKFTAPLTAITASVVGVIVNLALFFAQHALRPADFAGGIDRIAALLAVGAVIALFRCKRTVIQVIAACALLGLAASMAGI